MFLCRLRVYAAIRDVGNGITCSEYIYPLIVGIAKRLLKVM